MSKKKLTIIISAIAVIVLLCGGLFLHYRNEAIAKKNQAFIKARDRFNYQYQLLNTDHDIDETNEEIDNNPLNHLVQEYDSDNYDDSSEYNSAAEEEHHKGMLKDMRKDLSVMRKNDTGKYDYSKYQDKYNEIKDELDL